MLLQVGRNVWRVERARRATVLIDGAAFFQAVREALLKAERSVFITGWDIHSRTPLVGEHAPRDGFPRLMGDFISALAQRRPELSVYILIWDFAPPYAMERELFPSARFGWATPPQVRFCLDDAVPLGASQHEKLVIVDGRLAFSGGLDLTIRRWDTSAHELDNPARIDPDGNAYPPFHDVAMMVDDAAARALAELAFER
jgi:phosphatidylserine/phosphatidylglycerophosphate/cardiolipin synthase-like enzyme